MNRFVRYLTTSATTDETASQMSWTDNRWQHYLRVKRYQSRIRARLCHAASSLSSAHEQNRHTLRLYRRHLHDVFLSCLNWNLSVQMWTHDSKWQRI